MTINKSLLIFSVLLTFTAIAHAQSFLKRVKDYADTLKCPAPQLTDPVSVKTNIIIDNASDSLAVIVKASIYSGWHIYAAVPENLPYIFAQPLLRTEEGSDIQSTWIKSDYAPSITDIDLFVYEKQAFFITFLRKTEKIDGLQAGLYYQTCDIHQCLPPKESIMSIKN